MCYFGRQAAIHLACGVTAHMSPQLCRHQDHRTRIYDQTAWLTTYMLTAPFTFAFTDQVKGHDLKA